MWMVDELLEVPTHSQWRPGELTSVYMWDNFPFTLLFPFLLQKYSPSWWDCNLFTSWAVWLICVEVTESISSLYSQQLMLCTQACSSRDMRPFLFTDQTGSVFVFGGSGRSPPLLWTRVLEIEPQRWTCAVYLQQPSMSKNHAMTLVALSVSPPLSAFPSWFSSACRHRKLT